MTKMVLHLSPTIMHAIDHIDQGLPINREALRRHAKEVLATTVGTKLPTVKDVALMKICGYENEAPTSQDLQDPLEVAKAAWAEWASSGLTPTTKEALTNYLEHGSPHQDGVLRATTANHLGAAVIQLISDPEDRRGLEDFKRARELAVHLGLEDSEPLCWAFVATYASPNTHS